MAKKVPSAGVRLGKGVPGKSFGGAGQKNPKFAKIGGQSNGVTVQSFPKKGR